MDRELRHLAQEETKTKTYIRACLKQGDTAGARLLAKQVVHARRYRDRLYTSKAQLNSMSMQLQHQWAVTKVSGTLQKSTEMMKSVNQLIKVPILSQHMRAMALEMIKVGLGVYAWFILL